MSTNSIEKVLTGFVNAELLADRGDGEVDADTRLLEQGYVDSLGMMRLIVFIESELDIVVPLRDVTTDNFESIATLSDYLRGRSARRATG